MTANISLSREFFFVFGEANTAKDYFIDLTAIILITAGIFVVIGFVALILAQHGVHLPGLSDLTSLMSKTSAYIGLGLTAAAVAVGAVIAAIRIRKFLNETYSQKAEINVNHFKDFFSSSVEKLVFKSTSSEWYIVKNKNKFSMVGFKKDSLSTKYQERLISRGYKLFNPVPTIPENKAVEINTVEIENVPENHIVDNGIAYTTTSEF